MGAPPSVHPLVIVHLRRGLLGRLLGLGERRRLSLSLSAGRRASRLRSSRPRSSRLLSKGSELAPGAYIAHCRSGMLAH